MAEERPDVQSQPGDAGTSSQTSETRRRTLTPEQARALAQQAWAKRRERQQARQLRQQAEAAKSGQILPGVMEIWDRRLINPDERGSEQILLKQAGFVTRWINTAIAGRLHRAQHSQGWVPVRMTELHNPQQIADLVASVDGLVRRGDRGQEVLHKMPVKVYEAIQARKVELRLQRDRKIREDLAQAAATRYGGEAGDAVARLKGDIRFGRETTEF